MYTYTFVLSYGGPEPFLTQLMNYISRGSGQYPITITLTDVQAQSLRASALSVGFTFSKITRVPVPPAPELIP